MASTLGKRIALIDTEQKSASLYSDQFDFDVAELDPPYAPERFVEMIKVAEGEGYDVIVIDSITHEWSGPGGCLDIKDKLGGEFRHWKSVTPRHDAFIHAMLSSKAHIIATVRSKQGYSMEGKKVVKQGMEHQQRDSIDYEFTVCWDLTEQHMAEAKKDRTKLFDGRPELITPEVAGRLKAWLEGGEAPATVEKPKPVKKLVTPQEECETLFHGNEEIVKAYLVSIGWLAEGKGFLDLTTKRAEQCCKGAPSLLKKAKALADKEEVHV